MGTLLNFGNRILNKNQSKKKSITNIKPLQNISLKKIYTTKHSKKLNNPKKTYRKLKNMKPKEQ